MRFLSDSLHSVVFEYWFLMTERKENMRKRLSLIFAVLLVVGALAVVLTGTALAQEEDATPAPKPFGWHGKGGSFARGFGGGGGMEAAAEVLGLTTEQLATELWGGKSLSELADEAGVDLQTVRDAVDAANEEARREAEDAMRAAIEQAVLDEKLSREHADWMLEGLDNGYLGGRGFGGFGGCRGHGGFRGHGAVPGDTGFGGFNRFPGRMNPNIEKSDA